VIYSFPSDGDVYMIPEITESKLRSTGFLPFVDIMNFLFHDPPPPIRFLRLFVERIHELLDHLDSVSTWQVGFPLPERVFLNF